MFSRKVSVVGGMISMKKLTPAEKRRMRLKPYYAVLYSINKIKGRLPEDLEAGLASDPEACLLYAERVVGGRLPDHLHNALLLGAWDGADKEAVAEYVRLFPE